MLPSNRAEYLRNAIDSGRVVLFLGAGFSADCKNQVNEPLPIGDGLAELLWGWLKYEVPYDYSPLQEVFEAALKQKHALEAFIRPHLRAATIPSWYDIIPAFIWSRIYTTNVDDVVECLYKRTASEQHLERKIDPVDDYDDRDSTYRTLQYIKLNGDVERPCDEWTFGVRSYARRAGRDPWYEHFVRDYSRSPTLIIGSQVREPMFWDCLEERGRRLREDAEHRPASFLVAKRIPPPKREILEKLNIFPVEATTEAFVKYLAEDLYENRPPTRLSVLARTDPQLAAAERLAGGPALKRLQRFFASFNTVPIIMPASPVRGKAYLLGVPPAWEDVLRDMDAPRSVNTSLLHAVADLERPARLVLVHGSGGCGKSTVLKRVALQLAKLGFSVYFNDGDVLPHAADVVAFLDDQPAARCFLVIDNANLVVSEVRKIVAASTLAQKPPTIVLAARTNDLDRWRDSLAYGDVVDFQVPHLEDSDIDPLLAVLERHGLLGHLEGKTKAQQRQALRDYAKRQILVAMRSATEGVGFDQIIDNEFESLASEEVKIMYLVGALVTAADFKITEDELIGCSVGPMNAAAERISRSLAGILVPINDQREVYTLRHRMIAERVLERTARRSLLREAYARLLRVLAIDIGLRPNRRSRTFRLYRTLINFRAIFNRFNREIELARAIYEDLSALVRHDYHFWLQYGLLELENGTLNLASVYLASADELGGDDDFVQTAVAHLRLRQAIDQAESLLRAEELRELAEYTLRELIAKRGRFDFHVHHVLASQLYAWANRWCRSDPERRAKEIKVALDLAENGVRLHPRNRELEALRIDLKREFVEAAVLIR